MLVANLGFLLPIRLLLLLLLLVRSRRVLVAGFLLLLAISLEAEITLLHDLGHGRDVLVKLGSQKVVGVVEGCVRGALSFPSESQGRRRLSGTLELGGCVVVEGVARAAIGMGWVDQLNLRGPVRLMLV